MSRLQRKLMPVAAGLITGAGTQRWRHRLAEWRRRLRGRPHEATFYFRIDDPYSWLLAQVLPRFAEHFGVSDNQHLFGVLESLFLFSFSRYGGSAGGASGPRILGAKGWRPLRFLVQANM